jgi:hypothetical protein
MDRERPFAVCFRAECERRDEFWAKILGRFRCDLDAFCAEWVVEPEQPLAPIVAREVLELGIAFGCASCGFLYYGKPAHVTLYPPRAGELVGVYHPSPPRLLCSACSPNPKPEV